jgi:serine/threonine protein kinase
MLDSNQLVGRTLAGKYQLLKLLGQGGMGMVFEGRNLEFGKRVAIKLIDNSHAQSAELAARLRREARAASAIESDSIVQVFDVGDDETTGVFMVMEFLVGEDLSSRIRREQRIDVGTAITIAYSIARALARAHGAGVVHRDLKPANVFLSVREDGSLQVKLLDFGISKIVADDKKSQLGGLTRMGTAIGTPHYMSPEQAQGLPDIDGRTDVWALGGLMYEMLTGTSAYPELPTYEQTIVRILTARPTPLLQAAPWVPPAIAAIVDAALEHDLARRLPDAGSFARMLTESAGVGRAAASGSFAAIVHAASNAPQTPLLQQVTDAGSQPRIPLSPPIGILAPSAEQSTPAFDLKATLPLSSEMAAMYRQSPPVVATGLPAASPGTAIGLGQYQAPPADAFNRTLPMDGSSLPSLSLPRATTGGAVTVGSAHAPIASEMPAAGVPSSSGIAWKLGLAVLLLGGVGAAIFVVRRGGGSVDSAAAASASAPFETKPSASTGIDSKKDEPAEEGPTTKPSASASATVSATVSATAGVATVAVTAPKPTATVALSVKGAIAPTTTAPKGKPSSTAAPTVSAAPTTAPTAPTAPTGTGIPAGGISTAYPE